MSRLKPLLVLLFLGAVVYLVTQNASLFAGGARHDPHTIRLSGSVEVTRSDLAARVGGRIGRIVVEEGGAVAAGAVLVEIDNPSLVAQRAVLDAQRAQAQATYDDLADGTRPEEIAQARAAVKAANYRLGLLESGSRREEERIADAQVTMAEDAVAQAQEAADRAERLYASGVIPQQQRDDAVHALVRAKEQLRIAREQASMVDDGARAQEIGIAKSQLEQSQASLALFEAGATPETLARALAAVGGVDAQLGVLTADLAELQVRAPFAGVVDQILREPGEVVAPGQTIATLRNPDDVLLRAYLPEPDLMHVRIGQDAMLLMPDGSTLTGAVHTIASDAEFTPRNIQTPEERATQVFAMEIKIADPPPSLRDGMTIDVQLTRQSGGAAP